MVQQTQEVQELVRELQGRMEVCERLMRESYDMGDLQMHMHFGALYHEVADQIAAITGKDPRPQL
jgi:hypothetical protein